MNPLTLEWIAKAEGDYATMQRESQVKDNPNYDGVCFHAQQCAEKYFKAYLQEIGAVIERTHDLVVLFQIVQSYHLFWETMPEGLSIVTDCAVAHRYPGYRSDVQIAQIAVQCCDEIRTVMRGALFSA